MTAFLPCLYALFACVAFSFMLEEKNPKIIISCAITGLLSWFVYIIFGFIGEGAWGETIRFLIAAIVVALLAELFARLHKAPATIFLTIGIIPLVPGGGLYYTMEALLDGNISRFTAQGLKTVAFAGAIAVGCSLVSSVVRMISQAKQNKYLR